jgi:DNA-binding NtrC family response regulator
VEHHVVLADGPELKVIHLADDTDSNRCPGLDDDLPTLADLEKRYIKKVMDHYNGNRKMVAEKLGIDKSTLWRKLQQYE